MSERYVFRAVRNLTIFRNNDIRRRLAEDTASAHPHVIVMFAALVRMPDGDDWELQEDFDCPDWDFQEDFDYPILEGVSIEDNELLEEPPGGSQGEINLQHNETDTSAHDETDTSAHDETDIRVDNAVEHQFEYGMQVRPLAEYLHDDERVPIVRLPPQVPDVHKPSREDRSEDGLQTITPTEQLFRDEMIPVTQTRPIPAAEVPAGEGRSEDELQTRTPTKHLRDDESVPVAPGHGLDPTDSQSDAYSLALLMSTPYTPIQGPCLLDVDDPKFSPKLDENKSSEDRPFPSIDTDTEANATPHRQPNAGNSSRSSIDIDVEHVEHVEHVKHAKNIKEDKTLCSNDPLDKLALTLENIRITYQKLFNEKCKRPPPEDREVIKVTEGYLFWLRLSLQHSNDSLSIQEPTYKVKKRILQRRQLVAKLKARRRQVEKKPRESRPNPLRHSFTTDELEQWEIKQQAFIEARKREERVDFW